MKQTRQRRAAGQAFAAILTIGGAAILAGGCVRRTMTIASVPDGARVFVNDQEIGESPATIDFTWYGDYDIILRKQGYETLQTHWKIDAPWYQVPPIDFFAEVLTPIRIHDRHHREFELVPAEAMPRSELVERANELRDRTLFQKD